MSKLNSKKQVVSTPSVFSVDTSFTDERFMKVRICAMCTGINRNNSRFSLDVIEAAKDSFANIPILANVVEYFDKNGERHLDYGGHDFHIEDDAFDDENERLIYDEKVCGIVPETNNFEIAKNEETGEHEVYVDALLYRDYGNYVCDILAERDGKTDVSMEINCSDIAISAKDKCIDVGKMTACAITLLGADVMPAMNNAHAETFSVSESDRQSQMIEIMQALKESLDNYYTQAFNAEKSEKGGKDKMNKFAELLEKYGKSEEDVTFEYDGLSDEELEAKFAEAFAEEEEPPADDEPQPVEDSEEEGDGDDVVSYSVTFGDVTKTYAKSLSDIQSAVTSLVNETYGEIDCTYYDCIVYDSDKYVVMLDFWNGRAYKQSYKVRKDAYQLVGDRVSVYAQYLTEDEINKLDEMRSNYSALETKVSEFKTKISNYESEPEKIALFESDDYALISESEEFKALKEFKAHLEMSVDDLTVKLDEMLKNAAKEVGRSGKAEFSVNTKVGSKPMISTANKTNKRFGSLFEGILTNK